MIAERATGSSAVMMDETHGDRGYNKQHRQNKSFSVVDAGVNLRSGSVLHLTTMGIMICETSRRHDTR